MLWGLFKTTNYAKLKGQAKKLRKLADEVDKFAEEDRLKAELQEKLYAAGTKKEIIKPNIELTIPPPRLPPPPVLLLSEQERLDKIRKDREEWFAIRNYRDMGEDEKFKVQTLEQYFRGSNNNWDM